ncbi:MAG TPA: GNAT family protein [Candidatus Limnocylindrales bacterium]
MEAPELATDRLVLRPVRPADRGRLAEILAEPAVARWWGPGSLAEAVEDFFAPDVTAFAIEVDGQVVGCIQFTEEEDPDYRHAGIDLFLDTEHQGRGLGPEALRLLAHWLFAERGHHRLTIDPAAANERAIRAYEAVGFRRVGVMRRYERGADGTWHDGLLLDLLADELR